MKYVFISGIPASGKSYLAARVARATGASHFKVDNWREEFRKDKHTDWVDFFWNKNEAEYWKVTNCEEHWNNMIKQSEALWPEIVIKIKDIIKSGKPAIFEGVNLLPHLIAKDFKLPGIILLGDSFEEIFERNKKEPRWGQTEELQRKEVEIFLYCESPIYKKEAEKYGFKTFSNIKEAERELLKLMKGA